MDTSSFTTTVETFAGSAEVAMKKVRVDWAMRASVSGILFRFHQHHDRKQAANELYQRGVPLHVALRVLK